MWVRISDFMFSPHFNHEPFSLRPLVMVTKINISQNRHFETSRKMTDPATMVLISFGRRTRSTPNDRRRTGRASGSSTPFANESSLRFREYLSNPYLPGD